MFAGVNWLIKEVKECFLALHDILIFTERDFWSWNHFSSEIVKLFVEPESDLFQFIKVISSFNLLNDAHNFPLFSLGIENCLLADFLSLEFIKVLGDTSHQAQLWYEQDLNSALFLVLNLKQGLFGFSDGNVVLGFVVVKHVDFLPR